MTSNKRDAYLVGSFPFQYSFQVFQVVGDTLGEKVKRVPDGEPGDRNVWIQAQYPVLAGCAQTIVADGYSGKLDRTTAYQLQLNLKPGVKTEDIDFGGEIGFARYAISSYGIFKAMKEADFIPKSWRFQISIPTPFAVIAMLTKPEARPIIEPAYEAAMMKDVDKIFSHIPHDELAIAWDVATEMIMWEYPTQHYARPHFDNMKEGVTERLARLGDYVPEPVEMGYHLCYGDQNHRHAIEPTDGGALTELSNWLSPAVKRSINYIHMPVPRNRNDDAYFEPMADLKLRDDTRLYMGLVHYTDGLEGTKKRLKVAEKYLDDFGIATECGFGRRDPNTVKELLEIHASLCE